MNKLFATTRYVTGLCRNRGYVYRDNKVIRSCEHDHKSRQTAQSCANRMLRAVLKEKTNE